MATVPPTRCRPQLRLLADLDLDIDLIPWALFLTPDPDLQRRPGEQTPFRNLPANIRGPILPHPFKQIHDPGFKTTAVL
ncbi:hypothetical protein VP1G_10770 [Cytospora mali]|uniref:Uncharacterized protein n=1 Tax=Cytospora mali TaxID=578113 RepID=A0A194UVU5_CYTMA|nr:hypothetical protein VP1G_10770 [Valsa mali var. pyri (nom. inval.)]